LTNIAKNGSLAYQYEAVDRLIPIVISQRNNPAREAAFTHKLLFSMKEKWRIHQG
jgi:hypothetical protein